MITANKQQAIILTVDPATRRVEAKLKDGGIVQVAVIETGAIFRWPKEGETWTIFRQNYYWYLGDQVQQDASFGIEDLGIGDAQIKSDIIRSESGYLVFHEGNVFFASEQFVTDAVADHSLGTTNVHGIADTSQLLTTDDLTAFPQKFETLVGDGVATTFQITHNLNSYAITASLWEVAPPRRQVYTTMEIVDTNSISVEFANPPLSEQYRMVIIA